MQHVTLFEVGEAARQLECSPAWVRRLVDDGRLGAIRTSSGQRLILGDALEALVRDREAARRQRGGG
jgi:excisionase family DNA binding protein